MGGAVLQSGEAWVKAAPSQAPRAPSHLNQKNSPQPNPSETIPAKVDPGSPASSIPSGSWQLSDALVSPDCHRLDPFGQQQANQLWGLLSSSSDLRHLIRSPAAESASHLIRLVHFIIWLEGFNEWKKYSRLAEHERKYRASNSHVGLAGSPHPLSQLAVTVHHRGRDGLLAMLLRSTLVPGASVPLANPHDKYYCDGVPYDRSRHIGSLCASPLCSHMGGHGERVRHASVCTSSRGSGDDQPFAQRTLPPSPTSLFSISFHNNK